MCRPGFYFPPGQWCIVLIQSTCPYVTSVGATRMKPGSTVDDPEVAAMVTFDPPKGPFYSGGGFSNIFPSDCYLFAILNRDTDKIDNSGYLNTRDMLLTNIRRNIWIPLLLRLVNIMTLEMWEICLYLPPLHPPNKLTLGPCLSWYFSKRVCSPVSTFC